MAAATNSIRGVSKAQAKAPRQAPMPLSTSPRGNRSVTPTVQRASRITAKPGQRDYAKVDEPLPTPFNISGL